MKLSAGHDVPLTSDVTVDSPDNLVPGSGECSRVVTAPPNTPVTLFVPAVTLDGAVVGPARSDPQATSGNTPRAITPILNAVRRIFTCLLQLLPGPGRTNGTGGPCVGRQLEVVASHRHDGRADRCGQVARRAGRRKIT